MKSNTVQITPFGGLGEIGMNCMLIETASSAVLIDCGLMFSELEHFGVEFVIPNFGVLFEKKEKIKAVIATHGHEDHIGALPFLVKSGIQAPIFASQFTCLMIRERLKEMRLEDAVELNVMVPDGPIRLGDLTVTPHSVNHSIIDAMALFIDTPLGRIIHTGDFKMDPSPYFGDVLDPKPFQKSGEDGVLLLMSDSTNVERDHPAQLDTDIAVRMEELFRKANGLVVVSMFSSNVGRMANIFKAAMRSGKKIALTGRSMEQNVRLAHERGAINFDSAALISIEEVDQYDRNRVLIMSTGCQGEPRSALNRMANGEHAQVNLEEGDLVILSSSQIPGNEVSIGKLINRLFESGAEVLYDAIDEVHTSGHATRPELRKMIEMVKPRFFIPIHGEYRHLVHHARLAEECGVRPENIAVVKNGEVIEVTPSAIKKVDEILELRVLVDGREGNEVTKSLLKDRRKLAETGVVFCLMVREKHSGKILSKPQLMGRGLVNESFEQWLQEEALRVIDDELGRYRRDLKKGFIDPDLGENIRIELRRFYERNIGKKPTVVPVILDV